MADWLKHYQDRGVRSKDVLSQTWSVFLLLIGETSQEPPLGTVRAPMPPGTHLTISSIVTASAAVLDDPGPELAGAVFLQEMLQRLVSGDIADPMVSMG